mmetsp:Transcript_13201/g.45650  ORF Transcript_13201/g.45650 Transcript_13201/m.45650 type:complete len:384 (-) Transcript_13201:340-1491(-)|eukprot:CAMPEP_0183816956 /NCGR_PEP_ID=MMETSP0803_2-20130417/59570_1 /TAXON_ID=195967 /ORGANISM="Crustomastix stigmata, Strain CCMP3273" /LENGTH=383 /DNA_ID=CAMNT_0026061841 /DNA_START=99 /DNA_END=1250 /DNA_ORIENTATION=+
MFWNDAYEEHCRLASSLDGKCEEERGLILEKMWVLRIRMELMGKDPCGIVKTTAHGMNSSGNLGPDEGECAEFSFSEPYITVRGGRIYARSYGPQEKTNSCDLVFIHGDGSNHLSWFPQLAHFQQRHRCIVYDQRGFGFSEDVLSLDSLEFCNDLHKVFESFKISKCILVAQSQGAMTATQFVKNRPDLVLGLCLISWSPFAFNIPKCNEELLFYVESKIRSAISAQASKGKLLQEQDRKHAMNATESTNLELSPTFRARRPSLAFLFDSLRCSNVELRQLLRRPRGSLPFSPWIDGHMPGISDLEVWDIPTHFIYGELDQYKKWMLYAPNIIKRGTVTKIAQSGHFCFFEKPDEVNNTITLLVSEVQHKQLATWQEFGSEAK